MQSVVEEFCLFSFPEKCNNLLTTAKSLQANSAWVLQGSQNYGENDLVKTVGNMDLLQSTFILNFTTNEKTNAKTKVIRYCYFYFYFYDKANHYDNMNNRLIGQS